MGWSETNIIIANIIDPAIRDEAVFQKVQVNLGSLARLIKTSKHSLQIIVKWTASTETVTYPTPPAQCVACQSPVTVRIHMSEIISVRLASLFSPWGAHAKRKWMYFKRVWVHCITSRCRAWSQIYLLECTSLIAETHSSDQDPSMREGSWFIATMLDIHFVAAHPS